MNIDKKNKYRFVFIESPYSGYRQTVVADNLKSACKIIEDLFPGQNYKCVESDCPNTIIVTGTTCKIGDILFTYNKNLDKLCKFRVRGFHVYEDKFDIELIYCGDDPSLKSMMSIIKNDNIGVDYFFTEDEALRSNSN